MAAGFGEWYCWIENKTSSNDICIYQETVSGVEKKTYGNPIEEESLIINTAGTTATLTVKIGSTNVVSEMIELLSKSDNGSVSNTEVSIPSSLKNVTPLYFAIINSTEGEYISDPVTNNLASSSGGSDYSVGDTVTLDGIECVIIYDAGSEQSWGRYIVTDKNHDLSYYISGNDYRNQQLPINDAKYGYEWGGYQTETGITDTSIGAGLSNTNSLIGMNLQPDTSGWSAIWDKVKEFRNSHSDKWFVPSKDELNLVYTNKSNLSNLSLNTSFYYWSSSEDSSDRAWGYIFYNGTQSRNYKYSYAIRSRLCRYTTDSELNPPSKTTINITCGTSDAIIRYTIDSSEPTESSTLYEGNFEVEAPATIKAIGFKTGWIESDVASYEVEAPVQKLPTPQCHARGKGAGVYEVYLDNPEDYPDNAVIWYREGNAEVDKDNYYSSTIADLDSRGYVGIVGHTSVKMYISCEGYEDSDIAIGTLQ